MKQPLKIWAQKSCSALRTNDITTTKQTHYNDVIMSAMASQTTSFTIVYSTVYSGTYQRKHQSSTSLAFVRGIHRWPVNSPHKGTITRKLFPFDDVIIQKEIMPIFYGAFCTLCVYFIGFAKSMQEIRAYPVETDGSFIKQTTWTCPLNLHRNTPN